MGAFRTAKGVPVAPKTLEVTRVMARSVEVAYAEGYNGGDQVLSMTQSTITASAQPKEKYSAATSSSGERAEREYVPGRAMSSTAAPSMLHVPAAVATVFPGQFPVCWCKPVSALKSELFPTFGFPTSAKR